jgi:hypothetical protein
MSGNHEIADAVVTGDKGTNDANAMFNCIDSTRNSMTAKDYNATLQGLNKDSAPALPALELFDAKADVPPPPTFNTHNDTSDKELAAEGIKRSHGFDDDGTKNAKVEFPNGVKITSSGPSAEHSLGDGNKVQVTNTSIVETATKVHEHPHGSGVQVDSHNKPIYKDNADGSKEVYTDTGVYKANSDGTVEKESAIKNRNGSWTVIDTSTPLGDMKPSDLGSSNKRH